MRLAASPSKYRNHRVTINGVRFDSKREAENHLKLQVLQRAGVIKNLRHQVRYPLVVNGHHVCAYIADHVYEEEGREVVADTKSAHTRKLPAYRIKAKLFHAIYGMEIKEL